MLDPRESSNINPHLADETEAKILATCRKLLKSADFGTDDNFFESGGNSLLAMVLAVELENQFGIKLGPEALFGRPTVREICASLQEGVRAGPISVLPLTGDLARTSLYFIHAAFEFSPMCERLSPEISASFVTINDQKWLRELMSSHDIPAVVDQITEAYADVIASLRNDGPLYLAGHSSGGIFAVETARNLEKQGVKLDYIFLFDTYLHSWGRRTIHDVFHNALLVGKIRNTFAQYWERAFAWSNSEPIAGKVSGITQTDATSEAEFGSLLAELREKAAEAYRGPKCALACPTVLFQATRMVDGRPRNISPDLGWARLLEPRLSVVRVATDHFNMVKGQHGSFIAEEIKRFARLSSDATRSSRCIDDSRE